MKIALVLGTRPEIIKLAPIIKKIGSKNCSVIFTGQHYDRKMGLGFMRDLDLPKPDYSLNITKSNPQLQISEIIGKLYIQKSMCTPGVHSYLPCEMHTKITVHA